MNTVENFNLLPYRSDLVGLSQKHTSRWSNQILGLFDSGFIALIWHIALHKSLRPLRGFIENLDRTAVDIALPVLLLLLFPGLVNINAAFLDLN